MEIYNYSIISKNMKQIDRYLTQKDENTPSTQIPQFHIIKNLKFRSTKKQSLQKIHNQSTLHHTRKYTNDHQSLTHMIQTLRSQNNQLKHLNKIQHTQLSHSLQQEKQLLKLTISSHENNNDNDNKFKYQKKLSLENAHLKKQLQKLQQQNLQIKTSIKSTNIKQLQITIKVYEQQIKKLFSKLIGYQKSLTTIQDINKVIQKQYYSQIKNKQLSHLLQQKTQQLTSSNKTITKLKNIILIKNKQLQKLKQQKQYFTNSKKYKLLDQYVHKNQLLSTKKQLTTLTQTISKLYQTLTQSQQKIQSLKQQNIDNITKQMSRRSQLILQLQKFKQNNQNLQHALDRCNKNNQSCTKAVSEFKFKKMNSEIKKLKNPLSVHLQHVKQAIQCVIHSLQSNNIPHQQAINLIMNCDHRLKLGQNQVPSQEQLNNFMINIRQVIFCFELPPINMDNFDQKQLLARYMVESEQNAQKKYMDYDDVLANINYCRSIFKQILGQYPLFTANKITQHCAYVQQFIRRYDPLLKISLSKMHPSSKTPYITSLQNSTDISLLKDIKLVYPCKQYLQAIIKQNQLTTQTIQFIKFWIYKVKDNYYTLDQFITLFHQENRIAFITQSQQPIQFNHQQNNNQSSVIANVQKNNQVIVNGQEVTDTTQQP